MKIKYPFRLAIAAIFVIFLAWAIVVQGLNTISSDKYSQLDEEEITEIVPANRGNIYTYNNKLLAVTSSIYDIRFDGVYAQSVIDADLESLASDLAEIFQNKSSTQYLKILKKQNRYSLIKRNVSFSELQKLKELTYYKNPLQGGLIIETISSREKPNGNSAARTIGDLYKNKTPKYGLEYSYNAQLMGEDGKSLFLKKPGAGKVKLNDINNIKSKDGKDLITTLELDFQDILQEALLRQLEIYEGDFGTAILMEVKTGQIKAITNLKKTKKNTYAEILNFGVMRQIEPGSTIKLASIMAYFEDYNGGIEDTIDCKNGTYRFKGSPIDTKDSKRLGVVSLKEVFAHSSNIGVGRLIQKYYQNSPEKFINRLYNFGLGEKSKIDLSGIPEPKIPSPLTKEWSGISLPWTSFGYGINLTPLDILTFYNTVANNGDLVYPYLGHAFRQGSELIPIKTKNISHTICSKSTINKINILLREVVKYGTAKQMNNLPFSVSGKTGTTVKNYINYSGDENKEYQSSFVGFFPSEDPKYSCIVLIDSPNKSIGYYGSVVAAPVFKEVAHKIYIKEGLNWKNNLTQNNSNLDSSFHQVLDQKNEMIKKINFKKDKYPNVVGMHIRDALNLLQSQGYTVLVKGNFGNVKQQYPKPNSPIEKELAITLFI